MTRKNENPATYELGTPQNPMYEIVLMVSDEHGENRPWHTVVCKSFYEAKRYGAYLYDVHSHCHGVYAHEMTFTDPDEFEGLTGVLERNGVKHYYNGRTWTTA